MAKAPANESAAWRAALGLCDALNGAMNEREKAQIGVQNASDIHATDLGARRKDRPRYLVYQRERIYKDACSNASFRPNKQADSRRKRLTW